MNALAEVCWRRRPHPEVDLRLGVDAFDAAEIHAGEHVAVVGAFVPFLRKLKQRRQSFTVLEQDAATLKPDEMPFSRPADQAGRVIPEADVVIITGTTLINGTPDDLTGGLLYANRLQNLACDAHCAGSIWREAVRQFVLRQTAYATSEITDHMINYQNVGGRHARYAEPARPRTPVCPAR